MLIYGDFLMDIIWFFVNLSCFWTDLGLVKAVLFIFCTFLKLKEPEPEFFFAYIRSNQKRILSNQKLVWPISKCQNRRYVLGLNHLETEIVHKLNWRLSCWFYWNCRWLPSVQNLCSRLLLFQWSLFLFFLCFCPAAFSTFYKRHRALTIQIRDQEI